MARYIAKNIVWSGLADKCEVAISYAIGKANPVAVNVTSFSTGKINDEDLSELVKEIFNLRPAAIIEKLRLRNAIYSDTATYGHFNSSLFPWENVDFNLNLRKAAEKFNVEREEI
jgi:S-adenosylmethionine synthetase